MQIIGRPRANAYALPRYLWNTALMWIRIAPQALLRNIGAGESGA